MQKSVYPVRTAAGETESGQNLNLFFTIGENDSNIGPSNATSFPLGIPYQECDIKGDEFLCIARGLKSKYKVQKKPYVTEQKFIHLFV